MMMMTLKKDMTVMQGLLLGLLLAVMGIVNYLLTADNPLRFDDLIYQYFCQDIDGVMDASELYDTNNRIDSFAEAFQSQCNHYMHHNGRFLLHFLVQSFCGFLGKPLFNVCNALVYMLFLYGCLRLTRVKDLTGAALVVGVLWFLLPVQCIFTMSVAHAVNYLWVSTLVVWFLILLRWVISHQEMSWGVGVLLFLAGLVTGATHEGFTMPLSVGLFVWLLLNYKVKWPVWLLVAGLWLGTASVVLAPATLNRATSVMPAVEGVGDNGLDLKLQALFYSKRLMLLLVVIGIGLWFIGKKRVIAFLKEYIVWLTAIIVNLLLVLSLAQYSQRMVFPLELLSVLLVILLFREFDLNRLVRRVAAVLVIVLMCVHVPVLLSYSGKVSKEYGKMVQSCRETGVARYDSTLVLPKYVSTYINRLRMPFEEKMLSIELGREVKIEE